MTAIILLTLLALAVATIIGATIRAIHGDGDNGRWRQPPLSHPRDLFEPGFGPTRMV